MRFHKNYILLFSLASSIIGLILIYVAIINIEPTKISINDITSELIGRTVSTTGYITYKTKHTAGHLFLTISDKNSKIQVPLFSSFVDDLNEAGITADDFKIGDKLAVTGLVQEFNNQLQIQPRKLIDVKILVSE